MPLFSYLFIKHPRSTSSAYQQAFSLASAIVKFLIGSLNTHPIWNIPRLNFWGFPRALGFLLWHGLSSFVLFFFELHYQEGYFCLPCNLINAGWWKIRREQTSTKGSGWIHQDASPSILSFLHFCHEEHSYFSKKSL